MKIFPWIFILFSFIVVSCRKGKSLDHTVYVHYEPVTDALVIPNNGLTIPPVPFDPNNPFGYTETVSPMSSYIDHISSSALQEYFNEVLAQHFNYNNIVLTSDTAEYVLNVDFIRLREDMVSATYYDSCAHSTRKQYLLEIDMWAEASLYHNGTYIDTYVRHAEAQEDTRTKVDHCNCPKIRPIRIDPYRLIDRCAKEVRMKVSRAIHDLEE